MGNSDLFISIDWGTTNFRLRVVETATLGVLHEDLQGDGVLKLHQSYASEKADAPSRLDYFAAYLRGKLKGLPDKWRGVPLVISGMASSSVGMRELPYASMPLAASGKGLRWEPLTLWPGQTALLVSGVSGSAAAMRGEEVQACGLGELLHQYGEATLILPGTHSKHLRYATGCFTRMTSYMTGELFSLLTGHSILAASVKRVPWETRYGKSFLAGVDTGGAGRFSTDLFGVRARQLAEKITPEDNYFYLSGLLIGEELRHLRHGNPGTIVLAADGVMYQLYRKALEYNFARPQVQCYDGEALLRALLRGQRNILEQYKKQHESF